MSAIKAREGSGVIVMDVVLVTDSKIAVGSSLS